MEIKKKYLIMLCGLPGTGKTFWAKELSRAIDNSAVVEQNKIRRRFGMRRMPKTQERVLRAIDRRCGHYLNLGKIVIFDSVNRFTFRRQQMYGVASAFGARVITLELTCSEKTAKSRMVKRQKHDGLLSDPRVAAVYDKLEKQWQDIRIDFRYPGEDHVSWLKFNTDTHKLKPIIARSEDKKFIREIGKILEKK